MMAAGACGAMGNIVIGKKRSIISTTHPKLRALEVRPVVQNGRAFVLLRDPLGLSDQVLLLPQALSPVLTLCDGTRDVGTLSAALALRYGVRVPPHRLQDLIDALENALFLEGERYEQARAAALSDYRAAPCRTPSCAGTSYPADPEELRAGLQECLDQHARDVEPLPQGRGVLTPHIDFARGAAVYARVWKRAAEMARQANLAIILGTDHHGGENLLTLTRQHYATPYGVLPTAQDVVNAMAEAIGEETAFAEELHHRSEHSIELAAVWLHHMRGGEACELVPVLCSGFRQDSQGEASVNEDALLQRFLKALAQATKGRRTLVIAAGDLSHVGTAFGGAPLDLARRAQLREADQELLRHVCTGDADSLLNTIRRTNNRHNVCGIPPLYLALRLLGTSSGELVAYDCCPADSEGTSVVSIAGVVFQ